MKNKKNLLIIISLVIICGFFSFIFYKNRNLNSDNKKIIGETDITKKSYGYPIISLLIYNSKKVNVEAGYYRYGDVNLDGSVDEKDIAEINHIINSLIHYSDSQKKLADVDENGKVNNDDIKLFEKYLVKNGPAKYNLNTATLEYCVSTENESNNCNWKNNNIIMLDKKQDYYFFVRQKDSNLISEVSFLDKRVFDEKEGE